MLSLEDQSIRMPPDQRAACFADVRITISGANSELVL
jgi:hypothetical protein